MNYLAHFLLAEPQPEAWIGALLGDFVKGSVSQELPSTVRFAVQEHRFIDRYTDEHAITLACRRLFPDGQRRVAGIALDIYFDHCLAKHWPQYTTIALQPFCQAVYGALHPQPYFPAKAVHLAEVLVQQQWLSQYQDLEWTLQALARLSRRWGRDNRLLECAATLCAEAATLQGHFECLMPDLQAAVTARRHALQQAALSVR